VAEKASKKPKPHLMPKLECIEEVSQEISTRIKDASSYEKMMQNELASLV